MPTYAGEVAIASATLGAMVGSVSRAIATMAWIASVIVRGAQPLVDASRVSFVMGRLYRASAAPWLAVTANRRCPLLLRQ